MSSSDATLLLPAPEWSDPRVHLLDDSWLLTIFAAVLATALPWSASGLQINLAGTALGFLALAAVHLGFTALINPTRGRGSWRSRSLAALHALGIVVLGIVWHQVGGLQNPAFLLSFALPVVGAIFLSRWQPYLVATIAVLTVAVVALIEAPELRWYASGTLGNWIAAVFGGGRAASAAPFPALYAPSGYFVVMLEVFMVAMYSCAVAAEYLGSVFDRLHAQVLAARTEAERGQELWSALIEQLPMPTLLVDAATMQVVSASNTVAPQFCDDGATPAGRPLFDAIKFSYPELIQELLAGAGGMIPLSVIHLRNELRITDVRVQHMARRGRRFAIMVIEDNTEAFCVKAALDVADHASMVLDTQGNVLAFNKAMQSLFPATQAGANAARLLSYPGAGAHWWEPSLAGRLKLQIEIRQRNYQVTSSALALPGESQRIYVVAFRPVARGAANDRTTLIASMV